MDATRTQPISNATKTKMWISNTIKIKMPWLIEFRVLCNMSLLLIYSTSTPISPWTYSVYTLHTHTRSLLFKNLFSLHADEICTNISVPACTSSANNCQQINNELLEKFKQTHPDVHAEACMETTGGYCLYTDITYGTCSSAKASELLIILYYIETGIIWALFTT